MIKIEYTTHSPVNTSTTYMHMDSTQQEMLLHDLEIGLYELLERSTYEKTVHDAIYTRHRDFNRHNAACSALNKNGIQNNMISFLSGLLRQHRKTPTKNISIKMLKGVQLCIDLQQHLGVKITSREFVKISSTGVSAAKTRVKSGTADLSTYNQLFAEG